MNANQLVFEMMNGNAELIPAYETAIRENNLNRDTPHAVITINLKTFTEMLRSVNDLYEGKMKALGTPKVPLAKLDVASLFVNSGMKLLNDAFSASSWQLEVLFRKIKGIPDDYYDAMGKLFEDFKTEFERFYRNLQILMSYDQVVGEMKRLCDECVLAHEAAIYREPTYNVILAANEAAKKFLAYLGNEFLQKYGQAEHDRIFNAPKPRTKHAPRKRSSPSRTGKHGTQTSKMDEELEDFLDFLKFNPPVKGSASDSINARATRFWLSHKKEYDRAAKGQREQRGYASALNLASAARSRLKK